MKAMPPRDSAGRWVSVFTREELRERDRARMLRRRQEDPETVRRWDRAAQRRHRARLSLGRPQMWKVACRLCLQFGHRANHCPVVTLP